jgi:hypothetical protein
MERGRDEPLYTSSNGEHAARLLMVAPFDVCAMKLAVKAQKGRYTACTDTMRLPLCQGIMPRCQLRNVSSAAVGVTRKGTASVPECDGVDLVWLLVLEKYLQLDILNRFILSK